MIKIIIFIFIAIVTICSCGQIKKENVQTNPRLIAFSDSIVAQAPGTVGLESYSGPFNDKTDTVSYENDKIYISYLSLVQACTSYQGDIDFKGDTLVLRLINTSDYDCADQRCDRLVFIVENKENRKYVIKRW